MLLSNAPSKLLRPFADAGGRNSIPVASQVGITAGAASLTDGFPPLTRTPIAAGGVPPSGLDMNGILYEMSAIIRWANAGGGYPFDGTFATDTNVGGYPKGARVMRSDGLGYWFNTTDNNTTDPEDAGAVAAGWVPDFTTGAAAITMTSANVTLTPAQYGKPLIVITGALTSDLNLVFPAIAGEWTIVNSTSGNFLITAKTNSSSGIKVSPVTQIVSDGSVIYSNQTYSSTFGYAAGSFGWHAQETYYASDLPWDVQPGRTSDQSAGMQSAFDFVKTRGGELKFKPGVYFGRIDFSGSISSMTFDGQGSIFRPFSSEQSEVFYAKNSTSYPTISGQFATVNVSFRNLTVLGRLTSGSDTDPSGSCDYAVNFICASAKWHDCNFGYGRIAPYHGYFHQYGEFWSCAWSAAVYSATDAGCLLEGNTSAESSNENRFFAPKFFSNKSGLVIKGGIKNRIYSPTIQDTRAGGVAGIWITSDSSGFGADGTEIEGVYAEVNNGIPAILVGASQNTSITNVELASAGESIKSTHTYNLTLQDVNGYNCGAIVLAHPTINTDAATVKISGGNILPDLSGLLHAGSTFVMQDQPAIGIRRNDSVLQASGQSGTDSVPYIGVSEQFGVKHSVAKATATPIFKIQQKTFATATVRLAIMTVELYLWDCSASGSQYGYSGHIQRYSVLITNNSSGTPQVFITPENTGVDLGINTAYQSTGSVTLTASVSSDLITFSANWPGAGTAAGGMSVQDIAYILRGAGANAFTMERQ